MNTAHAPDWTLYPPAAPGPRRADQGSDESREALVLQHLPQVQLVARSVAAKLAGHVVLADLIGAGVLGLIDAVSKFDPARNASLSTYAQFRIRGAILDSLRSQAWGPRRIRLFARRIADARHALSGTLLRLPTDPELAAHLGTSLAHYQAHVAEWHRLQLQSFVTPDPLDSSDEGKRGLALEDVPTAEPDALQVMLGQEEAKRLSAAVAALPPSERRVVTLYYLEELTMREVGLAIGISESRVCQLHQTALNRLKKTWDRRRKSRQP